MRATLGIAATLILMAAATWAAAPAAPQAQPEYSAARMDAFELMARSKDLPVEQFDAF